MMLPAYCTNVHAGATLEASLESLRLHSTAVRDLLVATGDLDRGAALPIGWWLSAQAAAELVDRSDDGAPPRLRPAMHERLRSFFETHRLRVTTFNGFPFEDFHGAVVKHRVYEPDWSTPERLAYTRDLAAIAAGLTEPGRAIGISTLPLGWPTSPHLAQVVRQSAESLVRLVIDLVALRERTGVRVHVDLEAEPGCLLQRSADVATFAARHLRPTAQSRGLSAEALADHIGICHDICHAAVMGESQSGALATYAASGLHVGKVQISSAIAVDFDRLDRGARLVARDALRPFAEDRYLHQTMLRRHGRASADVDEDDGDRTMVDEDELRFYEDLPGAIAALAARPVPSGDCRIHYHVPIHLVDLGAAAPGVGTTQRDILDCVACLPHEDSGAGPALEVETYAWSVLPAPLRPAALAEGIAAELRWVRGVLADPARSSSHERQKRQERHERESGEAR